jgi:DNA uptake protein ComE-like DNA-binding protein
MHTLRTPLLGAALSAALALVLAACGVGTTPTTSATSAPAAATQAPATPASAAATDQPAAATQAPASASATEAAPTAAASAPTTAAAPTAAASAPVAAPKLNLNEVTEDQLLASIPDFSGRMVREFMEYRPYISIQQFRQEIGKYVSAEQVAAYEQYVYVPIAVDDSDAATLQQLPGVDATDADALVAGRPYGANTAFLAALAPYVSPDELAAAAVYLAAE